MKTTDLSALEKARSSLTEKQEEIGELNGHIIDLQEEVDELRTVIRWLEKNLGSGDVLKGAEKSTKEREVSAFAEALVEKNGPQEGSGLYEAYLNAGNTLSGKDRNGQMANFAGFLSRVGRLKYYRDHGRWWFADRPYPVKKTGFFAKQDSQT